MHFRSPNGSLTRGVGQGSQSKRTPLIFCTLELIQKHHNLFILLVYRHNVALFLSFWLLNGLAVISNNHATALFEVQY